MSANEASQWVLVDRHGKKYTLGQSMVFLGREECDIPISSRSVDKRHAVITFDQFTNCFRVKDLSSLNGTFVNDSRIPEQAYVSLHNLDSLRFGYDPMAYRIERLGRPLDNGNSGEEKLISQSLDRLPAWANKESPSFNMAECQGCMDEQHIHHTCTCGNKPDNTLNGNRFHSEQGLNRWQTGSARTDLSKYEFDSTDPERYIIPRSASFDHKIQQNGTKRGVHTFSSHLEVNLQNRPKDFESFHAKIPQSSSPDRSAIVYGPGEPSAEIRRSVSFDRFSQDSLSPTKYKTDSPVASRDDQSKNVQHATVTPGDQMSLEDKRRNISGDIDIDIVKKGSPLYGQPTWWGTDEEDNLDTKYRHKGSSDKTVNNNVLHKANTVDLAMYKTKPKYESTYMEIPPPPKLSEREKELQQKDEAKSEESSPEKKDLDSSGSMAFTVDFEGGAGEETHKISMSDSLSKFLPHKVRRSLREKKGTSSRKKEESTEQSIKDDIEVISPVRKQKINDLWTSIDSRASVKSSSSNRKYTSDGDYLSDGEDDISVRSDTNLKRGSQKYKSQTKQASSRQSKSKTSRSTEKPKEEGTKDTVTPRMEDSTTYLINKMFSNSETSSKVDTNSTQRQQPTEYSLYKEAKDFDYDPGLSKAKKEATNTKTLTVPKPSRSNKEPVSSVRKSKKLENSDNEGDNVSESGTYTIETEKESIEEKIARESIDAVFGISNEYGVGQGHRYDGDGGEDIEELKVAEYETKKRQVTPPGDSLDVEIGTEVDYRQKTSPTVATESDVVVEPNKSPDDLTFPLTEVDKSEESPPHMNKRPPSGGSSSSRKIKPGSGRKLPSIPGGISPRGNSESPRHSQSTQKSDVIVNKSYSSRISDVMSVPDEGRRIVTREETWEAFTGQSVTCSIDTDVLLNDTHHVMAVVEAKARDQNQRENLKKYDQRLSGKSEKLQPADYSDSDESMTIPVNGHIDLHVSEDCDVLIEDESRPVTSHSHVTDASLGAKIAKKGRENNTIGKPFNRSNYSGGVMNKETTYYDRKTHSKDSGIPSANRSTDLSKAAIIRDRSIDIKTQERLGRKVQDVMERLNKESMKKSKEYDLLSDVMSEPNNCEFDNTSDLSARSDVSDGSPKQSSKFARGKQGVITNTRPNRTFELRRARLENEAAKKVASPRRKVSTSSKDRPHSAVTDSQSVVSLGAKIASKGRDNTRRSDNTFMRSDGGRYSMRLPRTSSVSSSVSSSVTVKHDSKMSRNRLSSSKSSGSTSQPGSRSNSPSLTAEMKAWQRRKTYDPRRAVAEAKNKAKDTRINTRMNRSVSYNSASDFDVRSSRDSESDLNDSIDVQSVESYVSDEYTDRTERKQAKELSKRLTSELEIAKISSELAKDLDILSRGEDLCDETEERYKRSKEPMNGYAHRQIPDEDTDGHLVGSDQELSPSSIGSSSNTRSAFSVPSKSPSPMRSPPPPLSAHKRSRDLGMDVSRRKEREAGESYDSLIISSIYQLAYKLKLTTDKSLAKLREHHHVSRTPSPLDEMGSYPSESEIPHFKSANQELAGILRNLRKVEHHLQVMDKTMYPRQEHSPPGTSNLTATEHKEYLREIKRIQTEIASFHPIHTPPDKSWSDPTLQDKELW